MTNHGLQSGVEKRHRLPDEQSTVPRLDLNRGERAIPGVIDDLGSVLVPPR